MNVADTEHDARPARARRLRAHRRSGARRPDPDQHLRRAREGRGAGVRARQHARPRKARPGRGPRHHRLHGRAPQGRDPRSARPTSTWWSAPTATGGCSITSSTRAPGAPSSTRGSIATRPTRASIPSSRRRRRRDRPRDHPARLRQVLHLLRRALHARARARHAAARDPAPGARHGRGRLQRGQLLGQTVNSYRYEDVGFADLLRAVAAVDGIERIRFTSPYPLDFSDDVIAAMAETPKICKHVHLPLQSASDAVLERMRRGYDFADVPRARTPSCARDARHRHHDRPAGRLLRRDRRRVPPPPCARRRSCASTAPSCSPTPSARAPTPRARCPTPCPPSVKQRRLAEVIALQQRITRRDHGGAGRQARARAGRAARRSARPTS